MVYSDGQLITLYDFQHHMKRDAVDFPVTELVIDLDSCVLTLCRCTASGEISLLAQTDPVSGGTLADQWLAAVSARCGADPLVLKSLLDDSQAQRRLWNYYRSGHDTEAPALRLPGDHLVTCTIAVEAFEPIRQQLEHSFSDAFQLTEQLKITEDDLRIFVAGQLAESAPARYTLRSQLCGSPLMPEDSRFVTLQPGEAASALSDGRDAFRQTQQMADTLELLCITADGGSTFIPLAEKGCALSSLETPVYSAAVLAAADEPLRFRMGAQNWNKKLPFAPGPSGIDLVEAACIVRNGRLLIQLRRCAAPLPVYELTLES